MSSPWDSPKPKKSQVPPRGSGAGEELKDELEKAETLECYECGFCGPKLKKHTGFQWYHFLLMPFLIVFGFGLLGLIILVFWAVSSKPACARCGATWGIVPFSGDVNDDAKAVWVEAEAKDSRQLWTNVIATSVVFSVVLTGVLVLLVI